MPETLDTTRISTRFFNAKPLSSWLAIVILCWYIVGCWIIFTFTVQPLYGNFQKINIEADSGAYYAAAGLDDEVGDNSYADQVGLGGSVIGPALVATLCRNGYGVAFFNCSLFALSIFVVAGVPGLQRRTFAMLMILDAFTLPALMTLNKEILALAGMALFAKYIYSRKRPLWLLGIIVILSTMARWQQTAFVFVYLVLEWRRLPFYRHRRTGIAALLLFVSGAWGLIAWRFGNLLAAYTALQKEISSGTIARLNDIQSRGGFFLAVWPKMLMNISGRLLQLDYVLHGWIASDFHELQNSIIGNAHSLVFLALLACMIYKGKIQTGSAACSFCFGLYDPQLRESLDPEQV